MSLLTLSGSLASGMTPDSFVFAYGITTGLFFAACIYMAVFAVSQVIWGSPKNGVTIFVHAACATGAFGLFHLYSMPLHFPQIEQLISPWVLFLGKVSAPIGIYFFIKMFMQAAPIKTLDAFLFWHRTRYLYAFLFAICWLAALSFVFIDERKTVMLLSFLLLILNCFVGIAFASFGIESARLSKLYSMILSFVILVLVGMVFVIYYVDLTTFPSIVFYMVHTLLGIVILVLSFLIMRYAIDESMRYAAISKVEIEDFYRDIYKALQHDQFFLEYQPKVDLLNREVNGMEALVRWEHPKRGRISPDGFIAAAEQTEIIDHICRWVIKRAVRDTKSLLNEGLSLPVSINFSVNNIHPDMVNFLVKTMSDKQLPADMVIVEITESLFLDMTDRQKQALSMLHDAGIALSLDDFGAGFSSLRHLDEMGLSEVKIDKSFALNLSDSKKQTIVSAIVSMSHALGISVVAEGVEDGEIETQLRGMACDTAQGYGICRPKRLDEVVSWINRYQEHPFNQ